MTSRKSQLLFALDDNLASARAGATLAVLRHWWRSQDWAADEFDAILQAVIQDGLAECTEIDEPGLRPTSAGLVWLQTVADWPPAPDDLPPDDAENVDDTQWQTGDAGDTLQPPQADLNAVVLRILAGVHGSVTARSLAQIWRLEGQQASELRGVLDALVKSGAVVVERGQGTTFRLA